MDVYYKLPVSTFQVKIITDKSKNNLDDYEY